MPLSVYPATPTPQYTYVFDQEYRTTISSYETGLEYRRRMWRFPKRTFNLRYNVLQMTTAGRDALYEFFIQQQGAYVPFYYFDFKIRRILDEFVAYGDGAEDTFDLPSKDTVNDSTLKVYVDSVESNWVFGDGAGEGGVDTVELPSVPGVGALITANFNGRLRIKARFKEDKMTEEIFTAYLARFGLSVYEVKDF